MVFLIIFPHKDIKIIHLSWHFYVFLIVHHRSSLIPHILIALLHTLASYHLHDSKQVSACCPIGIIVSLKLYHNRCTTVERSVHYSATNCSPECNELCTVVERMKWSLNDRTIKAEWHDDIGYMAYQSAFNQSCNYNCNQNCNDKTRSEHLKWIRRVWEMDDLDGFFW